MLPKIIHYCWFGKGPLPEEAKKCISSWEKYCPGYEIRRWDETNFDIKCCKYVEDAYKSKKWAFVSDFARFCILYNYGGIYFDTDVEMIKNIDDIVEKGPFMGMEHVGKVNPGLGLGGNKGLDLFKEIIDEYMTSNFYKFPGVQEDENVVGKVTKVLIRKGFQTDLSSIQIVQNIFIYPTEFFAPFDYITKELKITKNTRTIHHYSGTWINKKEIKINELKNESTRCNNRILKKILKLKILILKVDNRINELGIAEFLKYCIWVIRNKSK